MPSADDDELESEKNQQPVQKRTEKKEKYEAKQEDRFSRLAFVCSLPVLTSSNSSNANEMT